MYISAELLKINKLESYKEALRSDQQTQWLKTIRDEMKLLEKNKLGFLKNYPVVRNGFTCRIKSNSDSFIE